MVSSGLNLLRAYPQLRIYKGYDPLNPRSPQEVYPVKANVASTIKEGMIIFPKWNTTLGRTEWVLDPTSGESSGVAIAQPMPHIALTDADNYDVTQSDMLVGLPCSGNFVLHTPHYLHSVADSEYVNGATLTWGTDGTLKPTSGTTDPVVAQVVSHLPFDVSATDNSFKKDGTLAAAGYTDAKVKQVIKISTCFVPKAVADTTP